MTHVAAHAPYVLQSLDIVKQRGYYSTFGAMLKLLSEDLIVTGFMQVSLRISPIRFKYKA